MPADVPALSAEDVEILQELLNIAFGHASAELAARLGDRVTLSVPDVQVMPSVLLRYYVGAELKDEPVVSVVEHAFQGELGGKAFLVLSRGAGELLLGLAPAGAAGADRPREALAEAGRILVGSCLARLAELLRTAVSCGAPAVTVDAPRSAAIQADRFAAADHTLVLRTAFDLGRADQRGYLFLAANRETISWLRPALRLFMAQYE